MCCCAVPNVNGTIGYQWQPDDPPGIKRPDPPALGPEDRIVWDLPGRCGGLDSHCHHYTLVNHARPSLLVRHGAGEDRIRLSNPRRVLAALDCLPTDDLRYWFCNALFHTWADGRMDGRAKELARWREAAAEGRIKTRKVRGSTVVNVSIVEREG